MAVQDLTPQLRKRLSQAERMAGVFVILATLLMVAGFAYYAYATAKRKGWFVDKVRYHTFVDSAAGLNLGSVVKLMGFDAGEITQVDTMPPGAIWNVYVEFTVKHPFFGYIWTDSYVKVASADFLGNRYLEVVKGGRSGKQVEASYRTSKAGELEMWIDPDPEQNEPGKLFRPVREETARLQARGETFKGYFLAASEPPPITERLQGLVTTVEQSLPAILSLTNQVTQVLTNTALALRQIEEAVSGLKPVLTNATALTAQLRDQPGALGEWLLPVPVNRQLQSLLGSTDSAVRTADTNVQFLATSLGRSLDHLADLTGNLNRQVQANSLILTEISSLIVHADDFLQGLKRHWLLKGSFANTTNPPLESLLEPGTGGPR